MNLDLRALGPIAPGGTVFQVAGQAEALWLASPAGVFQLREALWRAVSRGIPFWRINTIAAAGNSVWVAGMPGGLVRSPDRGRSWHHCWADQAQAPVVTLAVSPNYGQDRVLLAGTDGDGILRTIDGGRYWELSNFGLREFSVFELVTAPTWDKSRYEFAFAVTEGNIYQSPNGGRAWRRAELSQKNLQPVALAVGPNFGVDQTVFAGCETGELLVSTDAGHSYHLAASGFEAIEALTFTPQGDLLLGTPEGICRIEPQAIAAQRIEPAAISSLPSPVLSLKAIDDKLYAGLTDGLYTSSDGSHAWQPVPDLSARRFVWGLTPRPDLWLAGGPEEGVWRSQNSGQSWQLIWSETPVLALTAADTRIWLSSPAGVMTSADAGDTWQTILTSETPITALAAENQSLWAGSHDSQLWHNRSGGAWSTVATPFTGSQILGIFTGRGVVVTAAWEARLGRLNLWRSEDEGTTWSKWFSAASKPITPQVAFGDEGVGEPLVGLGTDLHRLLPNGTWQRHKLTSPEALITALLPLASHTLVALTDHLVASATYEEWTPVEAPVTGYPIAALAQSNEQVVIVSSEGQVWLGQA